MSYEEFWVKFVRSREWPYPRELMRHRYVVADDRSLVAVLNAYNGRADCFMSVYSLEQLEHRVFDLVFLEVDNIEDDISPVLEQHSINYIKVFSGRRGYHYYLPIVPMVMSNFKKAARSVVENLGLDKVIDTHVVGNRRQMARVPYTLHPETGLFAYVCVSKVDYSSALHPPVVEVSWKPSRVLTMMLLTGEQCSDKKECEEVTNRVEEGEFPDCIIYLIEKMQETKYLAHWERLHLGAYLLKTGWSIGEISRAFSVLNDYREEVTNYHLQRMKESDFNCYTCVSAKRLGICRLSNIRRCSFYPSINLFVANARGGEENGLHKGIRFEC